jgi:hypothetical protein
MTKVIQIYPVSVDELNVWLEDAIYNADGHDLNVLGTIGIMLEDFSMFIHSSDNLKKQFIDYLEIAEKQGEEIH